MSDDHNIIDDCADAIKDITDEEIINKLLWACEALAHFLNDTPECCAPYFLTSAIKAAKDAGYEGTYEP